MDSPLLHELIYGCQKNDRSAQEQLYKMFYTDMFHTCLRYTSDPHGALTILNDAFLKVYLHINQFNDRMGAFRPWLKTVVIHTAIDYTRKLKKETHIIHIDHAPEEGADDFDLRHNWKQEEITEHLKMLPPVTRMVINLFAFDGYTHKDIAEQLNITESTSRWHVGEARKRLRNSMDLKQAKLVHHE